MAMLKSDDEIRRGWTNKERAFETWYERNKSAFSASMKWGAKHDAMEVLFARSFHPRDYPAFDAWCNEWLGRHLTRMSHRMEPQEFLKAVWNTNFTDVTSVSNLSWQMDMLKMPFIFLGQSQFGGHLTCYGFRPSGRFLKPDIKNDEMGAFGNQVLALSFNSGEVMDAKPRSLSDASDSSNNPFSSESSGSTVPSVFSDTSNRPPSRPTHQVRVSAGLDPVAKARGEIDPQHFVFAQLGVLHVYAHSWEMALSRGPSSIEEGLWWTNGFAIVVRLSEKGVPGAIYALYNHDKQLDLQANYNSFEDEEDIDNSPEAANHIPGYLHPRCKDHFRLAKVADSLKELGDVGKRFTFLPLTRTENRVVRAKIWQSKTNYEVRNGKEVRALYVVPTTGTWKEPTNKKDQGGPLQETKRFENRPREMPRDPAPPREQDQNRRTMGGRRPEWRP
ncbi:hypothetical protein FHETE_6710 [Fusarium heterosporum]|uniref:Uncharacterized protein n=1 Tax=Fusarium heterosporum TaxID=42747 RepID=A0A8H5T487_FUSHE|nr:hypothetical protein FHETE_6710 [Fusarium heterosporum]